jgi:hypothetical protein
MRTKLTPAESRDIDALLLELDTVDQGLPIMGQIGTDVGDMTALASDVRKGLQLLQQYFGTGNSTQSNGNNSGASSPPVTIPSQ